MSPSGESARVVSFRGFQNEETQEKALLEWSRIYNIPMETLLTQQNETSIIPSQITIRTASQEKIIYPSKLVFVPTDTKQSPSAIGGMTGIMGFNRGLTEDLGAKMYHLVQANQFEPLHPPYQNCWSFEESMFTKNIRILHALDEKYSKYRQDQMKLHRVLLEPAIPSPIMDSKTTFPFNNNGSPLFATSSRKSSLFSMTSSMRIRLAYHLMDLKDFALSHFGEEQVDKENTLMIEPNEALDHTGT